MKHSPCNAKDSILDHLLAPRVRDQRYWDYERQVSEYCREYRRQDGEEECCAA